MYTRISKTGDRQYLQLVESFRNDRGQVRVRVVANLGRLDKLTAENLDPLINGLNRAIGRAGNPASEVIHESARAHGNVFALHELWRELGFDKALSRALRSARREFDAEALIRAMVFNRLCEPDSKLGCLRWLETVAMPAMPDTVTHQQLLRAMDALMEHAGAGHPPARSFWSEAHTSWSTFRSTLSCSSLVRWAVSPWSSQMPRVQSSPTVPAACETHTMVLPRRLKSRMRSKHFA